jgi:hypothetical protein
MGSIIRQMVAVGFLFVTACAYTGLANAKQQGAILSVTEENDLFSQPYNSSGRQDRHYTQGAKLVYLGSDDYLTNVTDGINSFLPAPGITTSASKFGYVFGQNIYTPGDTETSALVTNDRPYAGWLYVGAVFQRRGETAGAIPVMENFEVDLGLVGEESLADVTQKTVHRIRGFSHIPRGWDNQLKTELGLAIKYARLWRLTPNAGTARYFDVIPYAGASLGNIMTCGNIGATVRLGWNLPEDFGVQTIDSPATVNGGMTATTPCWGLYAFGHAEGRAVGYNLFLDGNTYRSSPSVDKEPLVADLSWGLALELFKHVEISYMWIVRTEEFRGQDGKDVFGSITVKGQFDF